MQVSRLDIISGFQPLFSEFVSVEPYGSILEAKPRQIRDQSA